MDGTYYVGTTEAEYMGENREGIGELYGVVMITSASTSSWSNFEFSPSLSDVVTRVCP